MRVCALVFSLYAIFIQLIKAFSKIPRHMSNSSLLAYFVYTVYDFSLFIYAYTHMKAIYAYLYVCLQSFLSLSLFVCVSVICMCATSSNSAFSFNPFVCAVYFDKLSNA